MAEFKELIKTFNRMCRHYEDIMSNSLGNNSCYHCPLNKVAEKWNEECLLLMQNRPEIFEKVVIEWGEKHPEPHCPTWLELMVKYNVVPMDWDVPKLLNALRTKIPVRLASKIKNTPDDSLWEDK